MDSLNPMASIQLKVLQGELNGRVIEFSQSDCVLLGRVSDALICLPDDPFVSRHHLLMEICQPSVLLSDLGSRNGFFVNDKHTPPSHSTFVSDDDVIVVGTNRFHVRVSPVDTLSQSPRIQAGNDKDHVHSFSGTPPALTGVLPLGSMIGHYQIIQEIGRSWMGAMYQATDSPETHTPSMVFSGHTPHLGIRPGNTALQDDFPFTRLEWIPAS